MWGVRKTDESRVSSSKIVLNNGDMKLHVKLSGSCLRNMRISEFWFWLMWGWTFFCTFKCLYIYISILWLLSPKHTPEFKCWRFKKIKAECPPLILLPVAVQQVLSILSDVLKAAILLYLIILWTGNVCRAPQGTSPLSCVTVWSLVGIQLGLKFQTAWLTFLTPQRRRVVGSWV